MEHGKGQSLGALDRASPEPLYQQIATQIEDGIRAGWLRPGDRVDAEPALAEKFGVSRVTVRLAIGDLARKGLVVRKQGKGTFVAGPAVRHDMRRPHGLFGSLFAQSDEANVELLRYELQLPPETVRSAMGLAPGEKALALDRLYLIGTTPVALGEDWLHPKAASVSRGKASLTSTEDILREVGFRLTRTETAIRAEMAGETIRELLRLERASAILVMHRNASIEDGSIKEVTRFSFCSDRYELFFASQEEGARTSPLAVRSVAEDRSS